MKKTHAGFCYKKRKRYYYKMLKNIILSQYLEDYNFVLKKIKNIRFRTLKNLFFMRYGYLPSSVLNREKSDFFL